MLRETNVGQIAATNSAWPLARYPILIFLDSDGLLFPHAGGPTARPCDAEIPATSGHRADPRGATPHWGIT